MNIFLCVIFSQVQWHPDVNKDSRAGEVFKSVRVAYEVSFDVSFLDLDVFNLLASIAHVLFCW